MPAPIVPAPQTPMTSGTLTRGAYDAAVLGTVYATTVVRPRDDRPYNVVLVDFEDGRRMSRVEGVPPEEVHVGMRVRLVDGDPPVCEPA
jgi:uncharacterized OB-fold protein